MNDEKVEQLIDEVEKRPALFLKNLNDYMDRNLKKKLWEEVCAAIFENWNGISSNIVIHSHQSH